MMTKAAQSRRTAIIVGSFLALALGCDDGPAASPSDAPAGGKSDELGDAACTEVTSRPERIGRAEHDDAVELSGIAVSARDNHVFWAVNDGGSGDRDTLFAFDFTGRARAQIDIGDATNVDWEDLARGPAGDAMGDALYVADIGDNERARKRVQVYRLAEPASDGSTEHVAGSTVERFELDYADGNAHDAEALLVHPHTGDLYIVTKERDEDEPTFVFRARAPLSTADVNELELVLSSEDAEALAGTVVGGDINPSGTAIVLHYRDGDTRLWPLGAEQAVEDALRASACSLPAFGVDHIEAIAFTDDGSKLLAVPEGERAPVMQLALD